jgi:hypothetical protein
MSKSIKMKSKTSRKKKKIFRRRKNLGQEFRFLAHSGGWIVPKIIF